MKIFNLVWAILFVGFAALQYNDPDPFIWATIYLYAALLCALAWKRLYYPVAYIVGIVVCAAYGIFLFVTKDGVWDWAVEHHGANIAESMHAEKPWIEQTREFFGLVIVIIVLLIDYIYYRKKASR